MTTRREQAYQRKMQELIDRVGKLRDAEVGRVFEILDIARRDVAAAVASTEWESFYLPQLREAVDRAVSGFEVRYRSSHAGALTNAWNAGVDVVDSPLQYAGIRTMAPELGREALEILQGYSADLIRGLAADATKKVNQELTLGILGSKPPQEVMKAVGRNLTDKGAFRTIALRAETITRTELGRVHSSAREARIRAVTAQGATEPRMTWRKKWISSGKAEPRPHHAALDQVEVPIDQDFPGGIPYPHAPGLPASETVNCGCTHVLTSPDWARLDKTWDPVPYEERAVYD